MDLVDDDERHHEQRHVRLSSKNGLLTQIEITSGAVYIQGIHHQYLEIYSNQYSSMG